MVNKNKYRVREIPEEGEEVYDERNKITRIYRGTEEWRASTIHLAESKKSGTERRIKKGDIWAVKDISDMQTGDELYIEDARSLKTGKALISGKDEKDGISHIEKKIYESKKGGYILYMTWLQGHKDSGKWVYLEDEDLDEVVRDMSRRDMNMDAVKEMEEEFSYELTAAV